MSGYYMALIHTSSI